jgi:hypothetical protein
LRLARLALAVPVSMRWDSLDEGEAPQDRGPGVNRFVLFVQQKAEAKYASN